MHVRQETQDTLTEKLLYRSIFNFHNLYEGNIDARSSELIFCEEC